jgi:hypothetical protein
VKQDHRKGQFNGHHIYAKTAHDSRGDIKRAVLIVVNPDKQSPVLALEVLITRWGDKISASIGVFPRTAQENSLRRHTTECIGLSEVKKGTWSEVQSFLSQYNKDTFFPWQVEVWPSNHRDNPKRSLGEFIELLRSTDFLSKDIETRSTLADIVERCFSGHLQTNRADDDKLRRLGDKLAISENRR